MIGIWNSSETMFKAKGAKQIGFIQLKLLGFVQLRDI